MKAHRAFVAAFAIALACGAFVDARRFESPRGATPAQARRLADTLNARLQRTIVLSLANVTIRDILDEIARQHGAMSWFVDQRAGASGVPLSLLFSGHDGWMIGTSVR
jgi:hypothetical protein